MSFFGSRRRLLRTGALVGLAVAGGLLAARRRRGRPAVRRTDASAPPTPIFAEQRPSPEAVPLRGPRSRRGRGLLPRAAVGAGLLAAGAATVLFLTAPGSAPSAPAGRAEGAPLGQPTATPIPTVAATPVAREVADGEPRGPLPPTASPEPAVVEHLVQLPVAVVSPPADTPETAPPAVAAQACSAARPGSVTLTFTWRKPDDGASEVWLDLSLINNGFVDGTFVSAGPFAPDVTAYTWDRIAPGKLHYYRVNTRYPEGWRASLVGAVRAAACEPDGGSDGVALAFDGSASDDFLALRDRLSERIEASGLNAAVAVTDLQSGETIDVAGDSERTPGCSINFFVLLASVMDLQAGGDGEPEVGELIASTIWSSNPIPARTLLLKMGEDDLGAGVERMNSLFSTLGLEKSLYDHAPAYPDEYSLSGAENVLTATEMNRALAYFYWGRVVRPEWRDYLLQPMNRVKPGLNYLIPAGVGNGFVSHKNGFLPTPQGWVDNDIGIVIFERNGVRYAYALSFFTQEVSIKYADIPLGQTVSSMVWQYFQSKYS